MSSDSSELLGLKILDPKFPGGKEPRSRGQPRARVCAIHQQGLEGRKGGGAFVKQVRVES